MSGIEAQISAQSLAARPPGAPGAPGEALKIRARKAADDFESVFLNTFVEQMFSGIETDGPFGGGSSEKIYRSFMAQEYAREIVASGGVGLSDQVYSEILRSQQASDANAK